MLLDDPIAVVLSFNESSCIQSEVLEWKLPTLSKRYIEACSDLKSSKFSEIQSEVFSRAFPNIFLVFSLKVHSNDVLVPTSRSPNPFKLFFFLI